VILIDGLKKSSKKTLELPVDKKNCLTDHTSSKLFKHETNPQNPLLKCFKSKNKKIEKASFHVILIYNIFFTLYLFVTLNIKSRKLSVIFHKQQSCLCKFKESKLNRVLLLIHPD